MFKAAEDFNPLRTIDVEWNCCMAVGFNPQIQKQQPPNHPPKKIPSHEGMTIFPMNFMGNKKHPFQLAAFN